MYNDNPGLVFVLVLLIVAANLFALYGIIRLAVTHAIKHARPAVAPNQQNGSAT